MVTVPTLGLTKEKLEKNQEKNENMAKIMTLLNLLTKHITGSK